MCLGIPGEVIEFLPEHSDLASILASGGASRCTATRNSSTAAGSPSTSAHTPSESLPTSPDRPSRVASE